MADYILLILRTKISIMLSWGCSSFKAMENGLMFHVQGFILNGWVKITYNEAADAFDVRFYTNRKVLVETVEDVYIDNLVDVIDHHVENDGSFDYDEKVKEQCSF